MMQDNECMYIMIVYVVYCIHDAIFYKRQIIIFSYEYDRLTFLKINLAMFIKVNISYLYARYLCISEMCNIIVIININRKII